MASSVKRRERIPLISGSEFDALTGATKFMKWNHGARARIKRAYRRRLRKMLNREEA